MLNFFREKSRSVLTITIIVLIIGAFALFGFADYFTRGISQGVAAKVDDQKITWRAIDTFYERNFKNQPQVASMDEKAIKNQIRTLLIQRLALINQAKHLGFRIGEAQIAKLLIEIPAFQKEGQFSKEQYLEMISNHGYSDATFRQEMSQDLLIAQLENGLTQSNFVLKPELDYIVKLIDQKRDFGYFQLSPSNYNKPHLITAESIQDFYSKNKQQYVIPEQVSLQVAELSIEDLTKGINASEEELKKFYEDHVNLYQVPERVEARHILITPKGSSPEEDEAAVKQASELLQKIRDGEDFAKLAKEFSADKGSGAEGGNLGWFVRGQMVPQFEDAAFALSEPNALAGPIRTQFGYHIIQLIKKEPASTRPYEEMKSFVEQQVKREKAETDFTIKSETLSALASEHAKTLDPIAKQMGIVLKETPMLTKQGVGEGLTSHKEVLRAAFSDALLKDGRNSPLIKINETTVAVVRIKKHEPLKEQTLEQVSDSIREQLANNQANEEVQKLANTLLSRIKAGDSPAQLAKEFNLEWQTQNGVPRQKEGLDKQISAMLFTMAHPEPGKPSANIVYLSEGDTAVLSLLKVSPGQMEGVDAKTETAYLQSIKEIATQLEYALYAQNVLDSTKIVQKD